MDDRLLGTLAGLAVTGVLAAPASASFITLPDIAASDAPIAGNAVARPNDGPRLLYHNPAGAALVDGTQVGYGVFGVPVSGRYENDAIGYDEKSSEFAASPTLWFVTDALGDWHVGAGAYGSVGTAFNFQDDPAAGVPNRFLGESTVISLGIFAAREVLPGLSVGFQIAPSYGKIRSRFPSPLGAVAFDIDGLGIGGVAGLLYEPVEGTTLGLAYRSPGRVWMSGDADVGATDDEVEITFHTPMLVTFGVSHEIVPDVFFLAQARWADYPEFEEGVFEFDDNTALDTPFIRDAKSRFRYGAGLEWYPTADLVFRTGFSYEDWMMEEESLSPILYDTADLIIGLGLGVRFWERWVVDATVGYSREDDRVVTADRNPLFPGRYQLEVPVVLGFAITYEFVTGAPSELW